MVLIIFILVFILLMKRFPIFLDLIGVILVSFIISYSLRPYYKFLVRKGLNRRFSAVFVILTIILSILLTCTILIPSVFKDSSNITDMLLDIEKYINNFKSTDITLGNNKFITHFINVVYDKLQIIIINMIEKSIETVILAGENILLFLVSPTLIYFFLCDDNLILNGILKLFPASSKAMFRKVLTHIDKVLERYIITQFELCALIGILTFIVLLALKVKFPLVLSLINAIFNIIPYFGPVIGAVPILILASLNSLKSVVSVGIALMVIQQIEGDIICPKIVGESVSAHPLTILILLLIGGNIGGVLGMIIIVPVWVTIKVLYEDIESYLF
ncbi:MAG: AI-2E family transporter [Clostridium argentinense]|uniref:AI-2E family transporter n=1 Tax=Clostridium faecium TaxID=2762223 RepID=A0ABR8YQ12_9CLOT|nr:AI-2E family transporter [Clostridium faecium]MBS5825306.1 AI-2E family transporter [Clostridium argentinense]